MYRGQEQPARMGPGKARLCSAPQVQCIDPLTQFYSQIDHYSESESENPLSVEDPSELCPAAFNSEVR